MKITIEQFEKELLEYDRKCGGDGEGSILDFLWYCYFSHNAVDDGWINQAEEAIGPVFDSLPPGHSDSLFDLVGNLITAYQRAAFLEGIQTGFQLSTELPAC